MPRFRRSGDGQCMGCSPLVADSPNALGTGRAHPTPVHDAAQAVLDWLPQRRRPMPRWSLTCSSSGRLRRRGCSTSWKPLGSDERDGAGPVAREAHYNGGRFRIAPKRRRMAFRDPVVAPRIALKSLAGRILELNDEMGALDELIATLVREINPRLLERCGIGIDIAGQLLVTAGDNPGRLRSEAGFAMLCGVAPLPASSGQTTRHRLNRGGDRGANSALHMATVSRMRLDPRTRAYVARRRADGLSKREIIRCLKRYIAREVLQLLRV